MPRESASKKVDGALLPTISFPAFATHDKDLYDLTKKACVDNLEGKHGFKRFDRDGFGCVFAPENERFYPEGLVQHFENVECEWPLFFAFMVIDGVFKQNEQQVDQYLERLRNCMCYNEGGGTGVNVSLSMT